MDVKDIKEIIETVSRLGIEHFEMENEGAILIINKDNKALEISRQSEKVSVKKRISDKEISPKEISDDALIVKSPMVGTYYSGPSPTSEPFVEVGSKVKQGDILCIIEAMKVMNEIISESDGEVAQIFGESGGVVEYGQPLMSIRK